LGKKKILPERDHQSDATKETGSVARPHTTRGRSSGGFGWVVAALGHRAPPVRADDAQDPPTATASSTAASAARKSATTASTSPKLLRQGDRSDRSVPRAVE
jgi:hypothetical protein